MSPNEASCLPVYAGVTGAGLAVTEGPRFCPICGSSREMSEVGCSGCGSRFV